jgi:hypothetical protein
MGLTPRYRGTGRPALAWLIRIESGNGCVHEGQDTPPKCSEKVSAFRTLETCGFPAGFPPLISNQTKC